jgi:hypothetical protein
MEVDGTAFGKEVETRWNELVKQNNTSEFYYGYKWNNQANDLIHILLIAVIWNAVSFFALKLTNRNKQK